MRIYFQYQKMWIRVLGYIPMGILVWLFKRQILNKLLLPVGLIYIIYGLIIYLSLYVYYKATEKHSWYNRNGECWVNEDMFIFKIKGNLVKIKFCDIEEIFMVKNNLIGSNHTILLIKWNGKKLKLISSPMDKETKIYETQFMEIFKLVKTHSTNLKIVKDLQGDDTDYWLKNF